VLVGIGQRARVHQEGGATCVLSLGEQIYCSAAFACWNETLNEVSWRTLNTGRDWNFDLGYVRLSDARKVLDVGPIHASRDKGHNRPYGSLAGGLLAVGGIVLLIKSKA
jgi:hypothetical protein